MSVVSGRWGTVSAGWLNHPEIRADEYLLLSVLVTYMRADGTGIAVSQTEIADRIGRSRCWVNRVAGQLAKIGAIVKRRRFSPDGGEISCEYRVQIDADGEIIQPDIRVPSVLRQRCGGPDAAVSRAETPVSPAATPRVTEDDTNQDSKIQYTHPMRGESRTDEAMSDRMGQGAAPTCREGRPQSRTTICREEPDEPTLVDERWVPTAADIAWAAEHAPDLDVLQQTQIYITGCRAKGHRYRDHSQAWRNWMIRDARDAAARGKTNGRAGQGARREPARSTRSAPSLHEGNLARSMACLARIEARKARREAGL